MKQTAVEWLCNEWLYIDQEFDMKLIDKKTYWERLKSVQEQAIKMEKEQIIQARTTAPIIPTIDMIDYVKEAEQYYNETYLQTHTPKHYRVWIPDIMEAIGGSWWHAVTDSCGRLYDPKHPNEDRDTVQWYIDNGYKIEEVTND